MNILNKHVIIPDKHMKINILFTSQLKKPNYGKKVLLAYPQG